MAAESIKNNKAYLRKFKISFTKVEFYLCVCHANRRKECKRLHVLRNIISVTKIDAILEPFYFQRIQVNKASNRIVLSIRLQKQYLLDATTYNCSNKSG